MSDGFDDEVDSDFPSPDDAARDPIAARRKAMDLLASREYCRRELVTRLGKAGFPPDIAESSVAELAGEGLVDDERFAESLLRSRAGRGQGPARIRRELRERGVEAELADRILGESAEDWIELARSVRQKKFGSRQPDTFAKKAKQVRFLEYRGFTHEQVRAAVGGGDD